MWLILVLQSLVSRFEDALDGASLVFIRAIFQDDYEIHAGSLAAPVRFRPLLQRPNLGHSCSLNQGGGVDVSTGKFTRILRLGLLRVPKIAACDGGASGFDLSRRGLGGTVGDSCCERTGCQTERGLCWLTV
jgi:hypothetical protein